MTHKRESTGGVIHAYQKYDPASFPPPVDESGESSPLSSFAFEQMMWHGTLDHLSDEDLARVARIDPSEIAGFLPPINAIVESLLERKRRILARYETHHVQRLAAQNFQDAAKEVTSPKELAERLARAIREEQIADLERVAHAAANRGWDESEIMRLVHRLGIKYQIEELASKYPFSGRERMDISKALEVKEELELIDRMLKELEKARRTGKILAVDLTALQDLATPEQLEQLRSLQQKLADYVRQQAESEGLHRTAGGYELTPKALRVFQNRVLGEVFAELEAARSGRHEGPVADEGAVETPRTKPYEFGDSIGQMDTPASLTNALLRAGPGLPVTLKPEDIEIHRTRNRPKCATCVMIDMSGSMRYNGLFVQAKRMALALSGLVYREYPGDFLQFIEVYTFAKPRHVSDLPALMPKPVTVYEPVVRLRADMSREDISEAVIPPHFTNLQQGLQLARRYLGAQDTPNRQVFLITDGLPTAHFEREQLYLLYPPDPRTEAATMREALACKRENITINVFLLSSYSQSHEDIQFANRMAEQTGGRVFYVNQNLERYVLWDYLTRRRKLIG